MGPWRRVSFCIKLEGETRWGKWDRKKNKMTKILSIPLALTKKKTIQLNYLNAQTKAHSVT